MRKEHPRTLEVLLDASKPPVPPECRHLHWLLFTPFRYEASANSRFRRAGRTSPVFYAAEAVATAVAEIAFWRLLFFVESPGTPWPANPLELTAFAVRYAASTCLDLTRPPYDARRDAWRHPTDYGPCHALADEARRLGAAGDPVAVGAGIPRRAGQPLPPGLRRLRRPQAEAAAELAAQAGHGWRLRALRDPGGGARLRSRRLRARPAHRRVRLEPLGPSTFSPSEAERFRSAGKRSNRRLPRPTQGGGPRGRGPARITAPPTSSRRLGRSPRASALKATPTTGMSNMKGAIRSIGWRRRSPYQIV